MTRQAYRAALKRDGDFWTVSEYDAPYNGQGFTLPGLITWQHVQVAGITPAYRFPRIFRRGR